MAGVGTSSGGAEPLIYKVRARQYGLSRGITAFHGITIPGYFKS